MKTVLSIAREVAVALLLLVGAYYITRIAVSWACSLFGGSE